MGNKNASTRTLSAASKRKNKALFIDKARERFGDLYDYSKVKYSKSTRKVTVICPKHGEFKQTPANHVNGSGCPYCSYGRLSDQEFVALAVEENGTNYELSNSGYSYKKPLSQKITIACKKHNVSFVKRADSFLKGHGCKYCQDDKLQGIPINKYDLEKLPGEHQTLRIMVGEEEVFNAEIVPDNKMSANNNRQHLRVV